MESQSRESQESSSGNEKSTEEMVARLAEIQVRCLNGYFYLLKEIRELKEWYRDLFALFEVNKLNNESISPLGLDGRLDEAEEKLQGILNFLSDKRYNNTSSNNKYNKYIT